VVATSKGKGFAGVIKRWNAKEALWLMVLNIIGEWVHGWEYQSGKSI